MKDLKQLVAQYQGFDFDYTKCGSKRLVDIKEGKCIYTPRTQAEIATQKELRTQFEDLSEELTAQFIETFTHRQLPDNMIGADVIARTIAKKDLYLIDMAKSLCQSALAKNDPNMQVIIAFAVEYPTLYTGFLEGVLDNVIGKTLPRIAISCDHDCSIYIDNILSRCSSRPLSRKKYEQIYIEGVKKSLMQAREQLKSTISQK